MIDKFTIMLPVHRGNIPLANSCITHLLNNCDLNIIVVDDNGFDDDYVKNDRVSFIHKKTNQREPLVKIWNDCIKDCPTEYVIIASWRQRPSKEHFEIISEKLNDGHGLVSFDGLHFFGFSKHLTSVIGFFDEGFTRGQFEDSDWWNRLKTNDICIYVGDVPEDRVVNSTWLDGGDINRMYYQSKWTEDGVNGRLIQHKDELNILDRYLYKDVFEDRTYRKWSESTLPNNLYNYFNKFNGYLKNF